MYDLEKALKENAVDDPRVRWKDPESWKCLSDEQRDIIHKWYIECQIEEKQEKKETSDSNGWACVLGLSPFAFYHALKRGGSFLDIILESAAALFLWGFIFFLASEAYQTARKTQDQPMSKLHSVFFHAIALAVSFFVVYCFYLKIK